MGTTTLAERAREARKLAGFAKVLPWAKKLGVSHTAISYIEGGKTLDLKGGTADAMARLSGLRAEWIRTGVGPKLAPAGESATGSPSPSQLAGQPLSKMDLAVQVARYWIASHRLPGAVEDHPRLLEIAYESILEAEEADPSRIVLKALERIAAQLSEESEHGDQ